MFNPWALLFYIVCLLFYFGFLFFYWVSLLIAQELPISSRSRSQKPDFRIEFCTFFIHLLVRVVSLDGLFLPLSRRVTRFLFVRNKRLWKKLSFFVFLHWQFWKSTFLLNFCYVKKSLFVDFVHNLFWTNLSPKFFFLYSFCLLLVVELLLRFLHQNVLAKRLNGLNIFVCSGFCMRFFSKELWEWLK